MRKHVHDAGCDQPVAVFVDQQPGITRQWIFDTLPETGVEVEEAVIDYPRLMAADEVFLSGTVKGIMPITRVDDRRISGGEPGPITTRAADLYRDALARN